ncbi:MAG: ABC transporter permease, partial [Candidatus Aminicenantes bacterium]|nr:ABC transporter permease [Candidatus Aminicenantes bacterium]
ERLPEVRTASRFVPGDPIMFTSKDRGVQGYGLYADERFFRVFSFPVLKGDPERLLADLDSIVVSRTLAEKLFGGDDPVGQTLRCFLGDLRVTGVLEDVPENSHIQFDCILPLERRFPVEERAEKLGMWNMDMYYTFLVLDERGSPRDLESKMAPLLRDQYLAMVQSTGQEWWKIRAEIRYFLQPLKSIHLESHLNYELSPGGSLMAVRLFAAIAVFILLIACVNAANLTTSRASLRAKEIGVRKSIGAERRQLIGQILGESMFAAASSLAISLGLVALVLPWFGRFADKPLSFRDLAGGPLPVLIPLAAIAAGLLAGLYPALRMSAFSPLSALKRSVRTPRVNLGLRNVMFLFQFGLTIILISAAFVVFNQMRFIKKRDLGYDRSNVVLIRAMDRDFRQNLDAFKTVLGQNPDILGITTASQLPANITAAGGRPIPDDQGREVRMHYYFMGADYNFIDVAKMEIVRGRDFSPAFSTDVTSAVLINETFVRQMGWANPVGKRLRLLREDTENEIVGVVKDFHFRSLHAPIEPLVLACRPNSYFTLIRIRPDRVPATLDAIRKAYDGVRGQVPFEATFLDDAFNLLYDADVKLGWMLVLFSGLGIVLGGMCILGLAAALAVQRTKEIGIRKVLGASVPGLLALLSREFTKWVLLANVLAWPIAFYIMHNWLQNFAYRTSLGIGVFAASALVALAIALLTAGYHGLKAALANPVASLRNE